MSGIDEILAGYENPRPGQEDFYRYLHQHPELSHQEHQTARRCTPAPAVTSSPTTLSSGSTCAAIPP